MTIMRTSAECAPIHETSGSLVTAMFMQCGGLLFAYTLARDIINSVLDRSSSLAHLVVAAADKKSSRPASAKND